MSVEDHDQNRATGCELVPNLSILNEEVGWLMKEVTVLRTEVTELNQVFKKARTAEHLPDGDQLKRSPPPTRRAPAPPKGKGKGKGKELDAKNWEMDKEGYPVGIYKANEIQDTGLPWYHIWKETGDSGIWARHAFCLLCNKYSEEGHRGSKQHLNQLWHMLDAGWPDYELQVQ